MDENNTSLNQNENQDQNQYQDYTSQRLDPYDHIPNAQPPKQNVLAIVGMILGILSLVTGCCGWYGLLLGIPGLICSILSRKQSKSKMAVAGIICSIIGMVLAVVMTVLAYGVITMLATDPEFQELFEMYY